MPVSRPAFCWGGGLGWGGVGGTRLEVGMVGRAGRGGAAPTTAPRCRNSLPCCASPACCPQSRNCQTASRRGAESSRALEGSRGERRTEISRAFCRWGGGGGGGSYVTSVTCVTNDCNLGC